MQTMTTILLQRDSDESRKVDQISDKISFTTPPPTYTNRKLVILGHTHTMQNSFKKNILTV